MIMIYSGLAKPNMNASNWSLIVRLILFIRSDCLIRICQSKEVCLHKIQHAGYFHIYSPLDKRFMKRLRISLMLIFGFFHFASAQNDTINSATKKLLLNRMPLGQRTYLV